ncbi:MULTISPECIES: asparaginase [Helicobacter]|uniref:asparaginase n=1 Tax=Helicobacter TaxID=209 RepID=UPI0009DF97A0|nr:asparaginase [Helicobacter sp. MIT 03-1616]TLD86869.1 asparaginase [Helicobacter sp. MIT 03-1616]
MNIWRIAQIFVCVLVMALGMLGCSSEEKAQQVKEKRSEKLEGFEQNAKIKKPNIVILATGGTIAGAVDSQIKTTGYNAGVISVDTLIEAVPQLQEIAHIQGEQIANIDSADMNDEIWLTLAQRVNKLLENPKIDGIVITHGTDTMEESAFFLHLTTRSDKPVVLTGAMRPSTAISADGPKNLYNALALAANTQSKGKGVMVVMNDRIQSARYVSKTHSLNVDAFSSPNSGDMGYILDGKIFFYTFPNKPHTTHSEFDVRSLRSLPKVDILYSYANDGLAIAAQALANQGTKGLVIAGSGAGSIHKNHKDMLKKLMQEGLIVVQSSRINNGIVLASEADAKFGFIGSGDLNPQKARVLLMLALTQTKNSAEIANFFQRY